MAYPAPHFDHVILDHGPYVIVTAFGATGNGTTDDSAAIQAALVAGAGRNVFFPSGTYLVSQNLYVYSGTDVFGCGMSSRIVMSSAAWAAWPTSGDNAAPMLLSNFGGTNNVNTDANITVRDLMLIGNPQATNTAWGVNGSLLRFIGVAGLTVKNLRLRYNNLGVGIVACTNWIIDGVIHDYLAGFATSVWWGSKHGIIKNVIGSTDTGTIPSGTIQINAQPNGSVAGANCVTQDIDVSGCSFYGVSSAAVQLFPLDDANGNIVRDVRLRGLSVYQTAGSEFSPITISGNCQNVTLSDICVAGDTGVNESNPPINIGPSGGYHPSGIVLDNFQFNNFSLAGNNSIMNISACAGLVASNFSDQNCSYSYAANIGPSSSGVSNIVFSNINLNSFTNANKYYEQTIALIDYLSGTFVPVLLFGVSGTGQPTCSTATGTYYRHHRTVFAAINIIVSSVGTATGAATIAGSPYGSSVAAIGGVVNFAGFSSFTGAPFAIFGGNTVQLLLPNGSAVLTNANFTSSTSFQTAFQYQI